MTVNQNPYVRIENLKQRLVAITKERNGLKLFKDIAHEMHPSSMSIVDSVCEIAAETKTVMGEEPETKQCIYRPDINCLEDEDCDFCLHNREVDQ